MRLAVELHGTRVGTIDGDARTFDFVPSPEAIERFGANSTILSVAIPLAPRQRRDHARRRRNWFAELLPEGSQYEHSWPRDISSEVTRPPSWPGTVAMWRGLSRSGTSTIPPSPIPRG